MPQSAYDSVPDQISDIPVDSSLAAAIEWLDRLLSWHVRLTHALYGDLANDAYRGLYVTDAEANLLVDGLPSIPPALLAERLSLAEERAQLSRRAPPDAPLSRLGRLFELSDFECDVLLLALAPEISPRYERLYAYIQDDVTRKRPLVALALKLLQPNPLARIAARSAFAADAPLLHHRLIQLPDDGQRAPTLLSRVVKLDDRIVAALLGLPQIDGLLTHCVTLMYPERRFDDLVFPPDFTARLQRLIADPDGGLVLALQGSYGTGRGAVAEALCAERGLPLLVVDAERLIASDAVTGGAVALAPIDGARRVVREAQLHQAVLLIHHADALLHEPDLHDWRQALLAVLDEYRGLTILALERSWEARGALRRTRFLRAEVPELSYTAREQIWRTRLHDTTMSDPAVQALASTFRLSAGQIRDAVAMAHALSAWRRDHQETHASAEPTIQELYAACRAQSSGRLDALAFKIRTTYSWGDIVLPADQLTQLKEICVQVRHRRTVLERWGFEQRLAMGKGVNVLFAGQSGTGKTMAAEIIAADLGLDLYKVDLATMVSKYIGETEKNLDRIFAAARESNAILFFDEADAIFGKRSEVKDAHDRYANIEVGYLLQKMEEYDGVVILATNLRKNMDDAFLRRLHVTIDFPFPEEPDRRKIWEIVFPSAAPLADDVDRAFLARQFKLAGGNIRNIALLSAFLAAEDGDVIRMSHLIRATRREYQKLGKLITAADFGPFLPLVSPTA